MTTSGSINFSVSAQDIITDALEILGVLGEGQSPTADQYTSALRTLNMMTKFWQADGLNLFAVQTCYLFLKKAQKSYSLYSLTSDHFTTNFYQTKTSSSQAAGSNTITVDDPSNIAIGSKIGIATSGTDMYWDVVANVASSTITLTGTLPSDVDISSKVFHYLVTANRPMRVLEAYTHRTDNNADIPTGIISRVDYWSLSTKNSQGQTIQVYFDPQIDQDNLYVWPVNSSELDYLILQCQRTLSDFDSLSNTPDYPQEWYMPLTYGLAVNLAPKYGMPAMDYQRLQVLFNAMYETAKAWDVEQETSVYLKPDTRDAIGRIGG